MTFAPAALEFDRVLLLVGSFARSQRGRLRVLATLPRFDAVEGSRLFRLTGEISRLCAERGSLGFAGLDAAELLAAGASVELRAGELVQLVSLVRHLVDLRSQLAGFTAIGPELARAVADLPHFEGLLSFCETRLGPDGEVLDSASPALAHARAARERRRQEIIATLGQLRRGATGSEAPYTVRRDRYCLPVQTAERQQVPGLVLDVSGSGATLFVEPLAIVEPNNALAEASALAREEEERVLLELAAAFRARQDELLTAAEIAAELDAAQARALFGEACGGVLLPPPGGDALVLVAARHPLLDPALADLRRVTLGEAGNTGPIVPLDLTAGADGRAVLLSGPNAGGKTVALKTVGLTALMAAVGIPVLAEEGSRMPTLARVWCHIGDEQNLLSELSTFSSAMRATAELLAVADDNTLVLYDELGSGTDPEEGGALAASLLEALVARRCWLLATAHLVTLAAHVEQLPGARNAAMGYDEDSGRPTYRLTLGMPGRSRGLAIARRYGLPEAVLARAKELLSRGFLAIEAYLERLEREAAILTALQQQARDAEAAAGAAGRRAAEHEAALAAERSSLRDRLAAERSQLRQLAQAKLAEALADLDRLRKEGELPGRRRVAAIRHAALDLGDEDVAAPVATASPTAGSTVRVRGTRLEGVVGRVLGDRVEVLAGNKRLWVEAAACESVTAPPDAAAPPVVAVPGGEEPPATELKLLGLTVEEAREQLERFLDHAALAGARLVRIVHGHGSGALRRMAREVLAAHPAVARFAHPPQFRGGTGVTEAELE